MTYRIVCMGNEIACDDGIGVRVGRVLSSIALPANVELEFRPQIGLDLLDLMVDSELVILVDAVALGGAPGSCVVLDETRLGQLSRDSGYSHLVGVCEIIHAADKLFSGRQRARIVVVGIEALVLDQFGTQLSPQVSSALPEAVQTVLELTCAPVALLGEARAAAAVWMDWKPELAEVLTRVS